MTTDLKTYSFTEEDINLITFSLRKLSKVTGFTDIKNDAIDLIAYIERLKNEDNIDVRKVIDLKYNEFMHEGNKFSVYIKDGFGGQQMVNIYKNDEMKLPIVGTTFGKMASFKNEIMQWAKKCIAANF